jgi:hypothetical protein
MGKTIHKQGIQKILYMTFKLGMRILETGSSMPRAVSLWKFRRWQQILVVAERDFVITKSHIQFQDEKSGRKLR